MCKFSHYTKLKLNFFDYEVLSKFEKHLNGLQLNYNIIHIIRGSAMLLAFPKYATPLIYNNSGVETFNNCELQKLTVDDSIALHDQIEV